MRVCPVSPRGASTEGSESEPVLAGDPVAAGDACCLVLHVPGIAAGRVSHGSASPASISARRSTVQ
ncbi:MAG TPA: hypothetical protein PKM02_10495, partial [Candidatus Fermentibacter daniensis]|nr:hypothetical protein [Candidatus Fermentibacter daniensis]